MVNTASDATRSARWAMLALRFVCRAGMGLQFQALGSTADPLVAEFGFGYTEIDTLIGLFMLPGLLLALGGGVAALALGFGQLAQGFGQLALGRLAAGAGFVCATLSFTKMVVDWLSGLALAYRAPPSATLAPAASERQLPREELLPTLLASAVWGVFNAGDTVYAWPSACLAPRRPAS